MKAIGTMVGAALALAAAPLLAQDDDGAAASPPGWYVAPLVTWMQPDSARCGVQDDYGAALVAGHRGDFGAIELWGQFLQLPHDGCTYTVPAPTMTDPDARATVNEPAGEVSLNGGGIDLVVGQRLFGLVGFGVLRREDHPQYATGDTTIFGDVGAGYLHPFTLFGRQVAARVEARYRYDVQQPPHPEDQAPAPAHQYGDVLVNAGLQVALSAPAPVVAEAAPEPVAVVPASDTDGDGVTDARDQCPDTPAATAVDDRGCAPPAPAVPTLETAQAGDTIVLHGVNFETASATLTANAERLLDDVARQLGARPALRVEVGGHTDSRGSDAYNQRLSEQRAQAVESYLIAQGVAAERLGAVGYGETQPADSNETDDGRERNRRVELKVLE